MAAADPYHRRRMPGPRLRGAGATIAAKNTLALARVVARSFSQHHPSSPFFVLLADEVDGYFDPEAEPYTLLSLKDLDVPEPTRFRFGLAQQPLSFAATPFLIAKLLELGYERVLFVKQESLVLGELESALSSLPAGAVALTPHLLEPLEGAEAEERELNILLSGVFNAGFVGVRAGAPAERFLAWWSDRVYRHCRHAVAEGMHYEQRWLDLAPGYFDNIHVLRDRSLNVAHWNLPDRQVTVLESEILVDGEKCRLFRFSGFEIDRPDRATRYSDRLRTENLGGAGVVFQRYRDALLGEGEAETSTWPYAYAHFDNGVPIPEIARHVYAALEDVSQFGDPFGSAGEGSYYRWLSAPVDGGRGPSRLWHEVYRRRPDLQAAFADPLGRAFVKWTVSSGRAEYDIPPGLG
jgi:hypothetical protein